MKDASVQQLLEQLPESALNEVKAFVADLNRPRSVKERLALAVQAVAPPGQKYSYLVALSEEISESNWKSAISGKQRPTAEMLEVFCKKHPEYLAYVMTGTAQIDAAQVIPAPIATGQRKAKS